MAATRAVCSPSRTALLSQQQDLQLAELYRKQLLKAHELQVRQCLKSTDERVRIAAILVTGERKLSFAEEVRPALKSRYALVREAAEKCLQVLSEVELKAEK